MHKQVSSLLSDGRIAGQARRVHRRSLPANGGNIRAIGGAEWGGTGAVAVLLDDMTDLAFEDLVDTLTASEFPTTTIWTAEAVLDDAVGTLADACTAIDDLNIASILVTDTHGGKALVSSASSPRPMPTRRGPRLDTVSVPAHTLTRVLAGPRGLGRIQPQSATGSCQPVTALTASETSAGDLGCRIASRSLAVPCPRPRAPASDSSEGRPCTSRSTRSFPPAARRASSRPSPWPSAGAELDIEVIGGAEWKHDGPLCLVLREDDQENEGQVRGSLPSSCRCRG